MKTGKNGPNTIASLLNVAQRLLANGYFLNRTSS